MTSESLARYHERKQDHADGFQAGWHAALQRVSEGDSVTKLRDSVPDTAPAYRAERDRLAAEVERLKAGFVVDGETSDGYHTFNELYAYRKALHALLANEWARRGVYDVHKSWYHSDGEPCFGGGWFIVVAELPEGQVSNHYKAADWALFQVPERERGNTYDGHTPAIALERLLARAALAEAPTPAREEGQ